MPSQAQSIDKVKKILSKDEHLVSEDGKLLKNKVAELARKLDDDLIELLLGSKETKERFFKKVGKATVFDVDAFTSFVHNKDFLPDSYTSFKNKIGLTNEKGDLISQSNEVVLSWPYKDCVLEGGQTKEDAKRDEIFWNEVLAPDEIRRLFEPKALTNWQRVDKDGEKKLEGLKEDDKGNLEENLVIQGNNLLALHSLKQRFAGKVKLIYIDPPYNTGSDSFKYNDQFNHSSWLTFMKNRLSVSRELLNKNGSIWINIDDDESHYLKVLCDEIFGRDNFLANIVWEKKHTRANDATYFSDNHDHILVYSKDKSNFEINFQERTEEMLDRYKNPDNDPRGPWSSQPIQVKTPSDDYIYKITTPEGREVFPPKGRSWQFSKERYEELVEENRIYFGEDGKNVPRIKKFISEVQDGVVPITIWGHEEVGHNQEAKDQLKVLLPELSFGTPKPERLLQRILNLGTNKGDLILDFFAGSGTTGAVAHKMGRKYILVEQMDSQIEILNERLKKVIDGDQSGISEDVGWEGGGDAVFTRLAKSNQKHREQIKSANKTELKKLWKEIREIGFLTWQVDLEKFDEEAGSFDDLLKEDMQKFLLDALDNNHLFVNYGNIDDGQYKISKADKELNKEFYE